MLTLQYKVVPLFHRNQHVKTRQSLLSSAANLSISSYVSGLVNSVGYRRIMAKMNAHRIPIDIVKFIRVPVLEKRSEHTTVSFGLP